MVRESTVYFSFFQEVYSYIAPENKWTILPQCKYEHFAMAVLNDALTTIGGRNHQYTVTNSLLSLCGSSWEDVLPPMPTKRQHPAATSTPTHLVVAGGRHSLGGHVATVEVLNTETLQWSTASSLPEAVDYPQMTTCGGRLYLADNRNNVVSCSVEDLLKSTNSWFVWNFKSVWTRAAKTPIPQNSSLTSLRGHVLAIGGKDGDNSTGAIHCYDVATNSWSVISEMPTPRYQVLAEVLPSNELVVVGGRRIPNDRCYIAEIGSS